MDAFLYDMKDTLGMPFRNYKTLSSGIYYDANEFDNLRPIILSKLDEDINLIWELCSNWRVDSDALINHTKKLNGVDFTQYSDEYLMNFLGECVKRLKRTVSYIYMAVVLDKHTQTWLTELLHVKLKNESKERTYFQVLTSPTKTTRLIEAKKRLEAIVKVIKEKGDAEAMIKQYTNEFKWLGYDTCAGKDLTIVETKSKIDSALKQKDVAKPKIESPGEIIKELNLSEKDKDFLDLINELAYLRSYRVESNMIAGAYMRPLIEELAGRFNTSYESLMQLTFDEIKDALRNKNIDLNEIEKRKIKQGMVMIDGEITIYSGSDVEKVEENVEVPAGLKELKGLVANHGKTRGYAKIILNKKDFDKVEFGDILVTKMTNPDFIVVLEKCGGIVTDIGGITCHAAIIARELNKPCVTGTKYATKLIKDGDLVELDANQGIVKLS